ncbi:aromatic ring-hydroxylating oxygenase subunit alpha [Campylobacter molothri]|uniref:aromatic ring-hydroxylating oxygenase subunit alpha n=1 Tax=Campylobacter molothri TaxID=1032242 RepID=UPI00301CA20E|nr:Rieske 2Fe-2S domain-containing protein [Campylobacter sp. W0047]
MKQVNDYISFKTEKLECENLYKKFWIFGCHKEEIKNNKDYIILKIYDFEVVIYNDNGNIVAFYNLCPHRGAKLLNFGNNESIFKSNGEIKCFYHHWTYKNQKLSIPMKTEFEQNEKFDLFKLKLDFCGDFIFFSHNPKYNLKDQLKGFYEELEQISKSIDRFNGLNAPINYRSNWKIGIENSLEIYHVGCVHPKSLGILDLEDSPKFIGFNSKTCGKIENEKIYSKLKRNQAIFLKDNYFEDKYFSYHLFPFTIISSTFGYAYSIQNYFPHTFNKTHFISRNYIAKAKHDVELFANEVISMNKAIFNEDAQATNLVQGSLFLDDLKFHYARNLEKRILYFHEQYEKAMKGKE